MKRHGRIEQDGKRRVDVFIDPDGGYILASRVTGKALERLKTMAEYRMERYEIEENGELLGARPVPSEEHQALRRERVAREKRPGKSQKRPTPPNPADTKNV